MSEDMNVIVKSLIDMCLHSTVITRKIIEGKLISRMCHDTTLGRSNQLRYHKLMGDNPKSQGFVKAADDIAEAFDDGYVEGILLYVYRNKSKPEEMYEAYLLTVNNRAASTREANYKFYKDWIKTMKKFSILPRSHHYGVVLLMNQECQIDKFATLHTAPTIELSEDDSSNLINSTESFEDRNRSGHLKNEYASLKFARTTGRNGNLKLDMFRLLGPSSRPRHLLYLTQPVVCPLHVMQGSCNWNRWSDVCKHLETHFADPCPLCSAKVSSLSKWSSTHLLACECSGVQLQLNMRNARTNIKLYKFESKFRMAQAILPLVSLEEIIVKQDSKELLTLLTEESSVQFQSKMLAVSSVVGLYRKHFELSLDWGLFKSELHSLQESDV